MDTPRRIKVLLADDEEPILLSTGMLLTDLGFQVVTTSRPEQIVTLLERERPDVLLQDLRMPGLDVRDLLQRIRAHPDLTKLRVVLFSASLDVAETAEEAGVACLEKPFRPHELVGVLSGVSA